MNQTVENAVHGMFDKYKAKIAEKGVPLSFIQAVVCNGLPAHRKLDNSALIREYILANGSTEKHARPFYYQQDSQSGRTIVYRCKDLS